MSAASATATYALLPELRLRIAGDRAAVDHFQREYGPCAVGADRADVDVRFVRPSNGRDGRAIIRGGHKTVGWSVSLPADPAAHPMTADIRLRGLPRGFGLSLVQGYFVEPLLSIAAARSDHVLLPAAAIDVDGTATVLIGRSGTGKSSLSVRALAASRRVLGDDQVFIDPFGSCRSFPRRIRLYSDLPETAPTAYRTAPKRTRASLLARRVVKRMTRGYVAPSLPVAATAFGADARPTHLRIGRILLLERAEGGNELRGDRSSADAAVEHASVVLAEQRRHLAATGRRSWHEALSSTRTREEAILRTGFEGVDIDRVSIPGHWAAPRAIAALAERLAI